MGIKLHDQPTIAGMDTTKNFKEDQFYVSYCLCCVFNQLYIFMKFQFFVNCIPLKPDFTLFPVFRLVHVKPRFLGWFFETRTFL